MLKKRENESVSEWQTRLNRHALMCNIGMYVCGIVFLVLLAIPLFSL